MKYHPLIAAAAALAFVEPPEGNVVEAYSPKTLAGEPHCPVCGTVMRCVDTETYGTDRVELRWVCPNRDSDTPVFTVESVWREPELNGTPVRIAGAPEFEDATPVIENHCELCGEFESECICDDDALPEGV